MLTSWKLLSFGTRQMSSWQIFGSALLERKAVIVKKFAPLEKAYCDLLRRVECENSLLSDFELQEQQEKNARGHKEGSAAQVKIVLTEDILREWQQEAAAILPTLKPKHESDVKSLKRCLDEPLTLLVKQKLGNRSFWLFPQSLNKGAETLRETAERAIAESVGAELKIVTLGNAPCSFYQYTYPQDVQKATGSQGAKVFYFKVQHVEGAVKLNETIGEDHMWATYEELMENLPQKIAKAVKPAIFLPPRVDYTQFLDSLSEKEEFKEYRSVEGR